MKNHPRIVREGSAGPGILLGPSESREGNEVNKGRGCYLARRLLKATFCTFGPRFEMAPGSVTRARQPIGVSPEAELDMLRWIWNQE